MSLKDRLAREIALTGPMTVADYVVRCLHDPQDGYYATRPAIGATGDFITAPMVSQMFGELIGLWAIELWRRLGAPERVRRLLPGLFGRAHRLENIVRMKLECASLIPDSRQVLKKVAQRMRNCRECNVVPRNFGF